MEPERPRTTIVMLNYDILTEIFETFNDSDSGPTDPRLRLKQQLYRAALTCQAFQCAALDTLWKYMDTIEPLLRLLPTVEVINGAYTICNPIESSDQARFDSYARRIRVFTPRNNQPSISPFTLSKLIFLPHLRKFVCPSLNQLMSFNLPFLLTHTLDTVELEEVSADPKNVRPFMYAVQQIAPELKHIVIRGTSPSQTWQDVLVFRHLRSLQLSGVIDLPLFCQLAALPELRDLAVDMKNSSPLLVYTDPTAMTRITFTKLRSLSLSGDIFAIASYFLHMIGGAITDVSIISQSKNQNAPNQSLQEPWSLCLSVLANQWENSLRFLCLKTNDPLGTSLSTTLEFYTSMSKLRLNSLHIDAQLSFGQCKQLVPSISNVRDLRVACVHWTSSSRSLLEVLDMFARYCPYMTTLDIYLGKRSINASSMRTSAYRQHTNLKKLIIGSGDSASLQNLRDILAVSKCIDRLFPRLEFIKPGQNSEFWGHVWDVVQALQDVRRSEQEMGASNRFQGKGKGQMGKGQMGKGWSAQRSFDVESPPSPKAD